jgi:hypothetical protein
MGRRVPPTRLGENILRELTIYSESVTEAINEEGRKAAKELVKQTRATAPVGRRRSFKKNITMRTIKEKRGFKRYIWYVKPPDHRLTHLLVNGHATRSGGRTRSDPFLKNALDKVLPEYERNIREAIRRG